MNSKLKSGVKRKHVTLTIVKKLKVIEQLQKGIPGKKIAHEFGISAQTVSDIKRRKEAIKAFALKFDVENDKSSISKRQTLKKPYEVLLEEAVYNWYTQKISSGIPVRGVELQEAALRFAQQLNLNNFACSSGWMWRFRQRHNITKKQMTGGDLSDVASEEPFRIRLNKIITQTGLCHSQIYNADETGLLWHALPENTQAACVEQSTLGSHNSRKSLSALLCVNADGSHRLKTVVVSEYIEQETLKHCPIIYYNSQNACFTQTIAVHWFHNHFVPEVIRHQKEVLKFSDDHIKALIILDNAPAHSDIQSLSTEDGKIKCLALPFNTTSLIQPMDQGIVMACKMLYKRKFLDMIMTKAEYGEDEDTARKRILENISSYNIQIAISNWANAWAHIKVEIIVNCWKKLLHDIDGDLDFDGFEPEDFLVVLRAAGETQVTGDNVLDWLELDEGDPGFQLPPNKASPADCDEVCVKEEMTYDELDEIDESLIKNEHLSDIKNTILANTNEQELRVYDESYANSRNVKVSVKNEISNKELCRTNELEDSIIKNKDISDAISGIDAVLNYVGSSSNQELLAYYEHLRTVREIIIKDQM